MLGCGLVFGAVGGRASTLALKRVAPPGGGYRVELPGTWRFKNESYPSDHATHLWFDPADPLRKMVVVLSGCTGCAETNGGPNPAGGVPQGAINVIRLSGSEDAFQARTHGNPWVANGISIVSRYHGRIDGFVRVELWLPPRQHRLATTILNSFRVSG